MENVALTLWDKHLSDSFLVKFLWFQSCIYTPVNWGVKGKTQVRSHPKSEFLIGLKVAVTRLRELDLESLLWGIRIPREHSRCQEDAGFLHNLFPSWKSNVGTAGPVLICEPASWAPLPGPGLTCQCLPGLQRLSPLSASTLGNHHGHRASHELFLSLKKIPWKGCFSSPLPAQEF